MLKCRCGDKTNLLVLVQETVVKLTKRLVLHNKLYENLRGFTYSIHTNTWTAILCTVPRLATVDEQTWRQVAGRLHWLQCQLHVYTTGSHMCAYPTWGQARRARRLVTCQHSSGPFGSLSSKRGQVFVLGVHKALGKTVSWQSSERMSSMHKKFRQRRCLPGEGK